MQCAFEYKDMISPYTKTTIVKPLREKNDFGRLQKDYASSVYPFKKSKDVIGVYGKQMEAIKILSEGKRKKFFEIDSSYSQLHSELEEIQKWKTLIEMESREKDKKIEELTQATEEQRKVAINSQLENENLNLQLVEEIQQRSFVSEKLHATKEMYSALKKHFNTLQGHFEYRNRIEDMIKAADNKRCADIENLKDMFNNMKLEQSDRIEYLNCALEAESNKLLDMRERFEMKLGEVKNEKEALCTMVRNYENQVGNLGKSLDIEKNKVQLLEKEKDKLKSDLIEMNNSNKYYDSLLREKEEALKNIEVSKEEQEKQFHFQSSLINELETKYRELSEKNEALNKEASALPGLKQMNEQLKNEVVHLEKKLKEEEDKTSEILSSLRNVQNENSYLEKKVEEGVMQLEAFNDLKTRYKELLELQEALLNEKDDVQGKLKDLKSHLLEIETDKEKLSMLCEEKAELIDALKKEYEEKLAAEANKLSCVKSDYEQLLNKLETTEDYLAEHSKACAEMEEKVNEVESLKTALSKAESELNQQRQSTFEVLKLLQDTEEKYNKDRLAKENEIIGYKEQVQKLEFETRMLKCEVEDLKKLKPENEKLKEDVETLKQDISNLLHKEEELRNEIRVYSEKCAELERAKLSEEKMRSAVLPLKKDFYKEPEKKNNDALSNKMHTDSDVSVEGREQPKIFPKRSPDPKPKAKEIDSSGSECLELVYDKKSHEAIGLSTPATKSGSGKNVPSTPNDGPKLLPFKTKRKREGQNVTQEDIIRKKFGLPPRKKLVPEPALRPQLLQKTEKHHSFLNAKGSKVEISPWRSPAMQRSVPSTPVFQRKFFTKRERDTPKASDTRKPWF